MDFNPKNIDLDDDNLLLTVKEAAYVLRVGRTTLYRLMKIGDLPGLYVGRSVRFRTRDLRAFIAKGGSYIPRTKARR